MLLSQAMRKGAESTQPITGYYFFHGGDTIKACALGAAYIGTFGLPAARTQDDYETELQEHYPELIKSYLCPRNTPPWRRRRS